MPSYPRIEQEVAGTAIKTGHHARWQQTGEISDTTNVDDNAMRRARREHRMMKGRHQRCAFATGGNITATKITNYIDASQFCQ